MTSMVIQSPIKNKRGFGMILDNNETHAVVNEFTPAELCGKRRRDNDYNTNMTTATHHIVKSRNVINGVENFGTISTSSSSSSSSSSNNNRNNSKRNFRMFNNNHNNEQKPLLDVCQMCSNYKSKQIQDAEKKALLNQEVDELKKILIASNHENKTLKRAVTIQNNRLATATNENNQLREYMNQAARFIESLQHDNNQLRMRLRETECTSNTFIIPQPPPDVW